MSLGSGALLVTAAWSGTWQNFWRAIAHIGLPDLPTPPSLPTLSPALRTHRTHRHLWGPLAWEELPPAPLSTQEAKVKVKVGCLDAGFTHNGGDGGRSLLQLLQVQRLLGRGTGPWIAGWGEEAGPW